MKKIITDIFILFPILCIYLVNREAEIISTFYASLIYLFVLFGILILIAGFELKNSSLKWASIIWFCIITLAHLSVNEIQKKTKDLMRKNLKNVHQEFNRNMESNH